MQYVTRTMAVFLTGGWLVAGCNPNSPNAEPLSDRPIPMIVNQSTRVGQAVTVEVSRIQDSRCPANALCIRYGSTEVQFTLTKGSDHQRGNLCLGECASAMKAQDTTVVPVGGRRYRVVLSEVRPYLGTGEPNARQEAVIQVLN